MKESEIMTIKDIMNDVNKLNESDKQIKDMMIVFANGLSAGEAIGYSKAVREVLGGRKSED